MYDLTKIRLYLLLLFIFLIHTCLLPAQEINEHIQQSITFSNTQLTVKKALDELNKIENINTVYSGDEEFLKFVVQFSAITLTIEKALEEIKTQAPVDVIFNHQHIIIKSKKLANNYQLKGKILDASTGIPLVSADVFIAGSSRGTFTGPDGEFSITLKPGNYQVEFTYLGYQNKIITVHLFEDKSLEIPLEQKQHEIAQVNITGALSETENIEKGRVIETLDSRTINNLNTNNVNDALHGRIPGVWTTKVSGAPGDHHKIRIRGISSIFGSTDPLYVVDGMIIPVVNNKSLGISHLNTHDVENITVLKDASSTALYGYLGGNGVVLIDTKKGGGETSFSINVKKGFQQYQQKRYDLMNSEMFLATLDSSDSKIGTDFFLTDTVRNIYPLYPQYRDSLGNTLGSTNFQDKIFEMGDVTEYQLSTQGSFKNINFYFSGNYYNHNGIITNSDYTKYSFTGNLSRIITDKISVRLLYKGSHQENKNNLDNYLGNDVIFKGINYEPAYYSTPDSFLEKSNRLYYNNEGIPELLTNYTYTPEMLLSEQRKQKDENANSIDLHGYYHLSSQFSFRAAISLAARNISYTSYLPGSLLNPEQFLKSKENIIIFSQQYDLNYTNTINNHGISAFIRYRNYNDNIYWRVDSVKNIVFHELGIEDNIYLRGSQAIYGEQGSVIRNVHSAIFNVNYNFKEKYFISAIGNYDFLSEGYYVNRRELFNSIALNYDLAREEILPLPKWINTFNLSANWGWSGNFPLNSLSNDLYSASNRYYANGSFEPAVFYSNLANHKLTHEEVNENNYGLEISLFRNRIIIEGNYYTKNYSDLLIHRDIPIYYGGGSFFQNIGEMTNTGYEASLQVSPVSTPLINWTTKFGISTNEQIITKLHDTIPISFNNIDILYPDFYADENETLGSITGYSYQGRWEDLQQSPEDSMYHRYGEEQGIAYRNVDTLGIINDINEDDKTVIGNSIPDFTFNFYNIFEIKNFTIEMLWYGVVGVDKYNATKAATYMTGTNQNVRNIVMDSLNYHTNNVFYESSFFVEDASFIRLKTLSISYAQPQKIWESIALKYTLSFENLITLTNYSGYDPESTIYTSNNFTDNAMDRGAYPSPKGIYFSINATF